MCVWESNESLIKILVKWGNQQVDPLYGMKANLLYKQKPSCYLIVFFGKKFISKWASGRLIQDLFPLYIYFIYIFIIIVLFQKNNNNNNATRTFS